MNNVIHQRIKLGNQAIIKNKWDDSLARFAVFTQLLSKKYSFIQLLECISMGVWLLTTTLLWNHTCTCFDEKCECALIDYAFINAFLLTFILCWNKSKPHIYPQNVLGKGRQ